MEEKKTFYEYVVDEIQRRYDNEEITYEQAVYADNKAYERYVIDPIINDITDEYDESTRLSREINKSNENKLKKLEDEKKKAYNQLKALARLHDTAKRGSKSEKSIEERHAALRMKIEELEDEIRKTERDQRETDTKYLGKDKYNEEQGYKAKKTNIEKYDMEPAKSREPGLYKKIQDNK
jgi:hypothetical protein